MVGTTKRAIDSEFTQTRDGESSAIVRGDDSRDITKGVWPPTSMCLFRRCLVFEITRAGWIHDVVEKNITTIPIRVKVEARQYNGLVASRPGQARSSVSQNSMAHKRNNSNNEASVKRFFGSRISRRLVYYDA
jgi:hypothetical protein